MEGKPLQQEYAHTEATRLLCAGVHLSADFRDQVVDELIGQAQRPVAPGLGTDVLPVLGHALRVRREEARTALLLLAVWAAFYLTDALMTWDAVMDGKGWTFRVHGLGMSAGDFLLLPFQPYALGPGSVFDSLSWSASYAMVVVLLWFSRAVSGRGVDLAVGLRKVLLPGWPRWLQKYATGVVLLVAWGVVLVYLRSALASITDTPYPVIFPLLIAIVVWKHQSLQKQTLRALLSRRNFALTSPPDLPKRYEGIRDCIRREQRARLTLYDAHRPFIGAGTPRKPWLVVLELQPRGTGGPQGKPVPAGAADGEEGASGGREASVPEGAPASDAGRPPDAGSVPETGPLTARQVIGMIAPRLRDLRASAGATSKDRLRELEVEEFVCLPSGVGRDEPLHTGDGEDPEGIYEAGQVERHRAESVGEGGEARRHFLRVRVGAWNEQVVVSLLVRVHTQGGILVLEVMPHVLGPITPEFRAVDAIVGRGPQGPVRDGIRALMDSPAVGVAVGIGALRALRFEYRQRTAPPRMAAPDAPRVSLRELCSTEELSLLQEMDVTRYIKTLQDRIGEGVRDALHARGYRTDRLEQNITHINSSLFIGEMSGGAVATGSHGTATHTERNTQ